MNVDGWTSWGWYEAGGPGVPFNQLRRWKWHGRSDVFVETNDMDVLRALGAALRSEQVFES